MEQWSPDMCNSYSFHDESLSRKNSDSYLSADSIETSVLCYGKVKFTPRTGHEDPEGE